MNKTKQVIKLGYTHYWKRVEKFDKQQFEKVVKDFKKVMEYLSPFVPLADGCGSPRNGGPHRSAAQVDARRAVPGFPHLATAGR